MSMAVGAFECAGGPWHSLYQQLQTHPLMSLHSDVSTAAAAQASSILVVARRSSTYETADLLVRKYPAVMKTFEKALFLITDPVTEKLVVTDDCNLETYNAILNSVKANILDQ